MNVRNVLSAILIVTAGLVANDTLAQSTQEIPDLFKPMTSGMIKALGLTAGVGADVVPEKDPTVVRSRLVELDSKILSQHLSDFDVNFAEAAPIRFNLFEDVAFVMITDRVEFVSEVQIHVVGHSIDDDRSRAYFVVHHGKITGNIYIDNVQYQIRPVDEDVQSITQIDQGGFVDELEPDAPDIERDEQDGSELDSPPNEPAVIDVAVFYTKRTRTQSNDIDAEISLAVLLTNESYANSQISQRLRLVYVAEVDYSGSGDLRLDRDRLQEPNDSHLDSVHPLRDARKADLVSLWVENGSEGACGIAFIMNVVSPTFAPFGFSVVRRKCATGYYSFGHELGHNMGRDTIVVWIPRT